MTEEYFNDEIFIDWTTWEPIKDTRAQLVSRQLKVEVGNTHKLFNLLDEIELRAADKASDSVLAFDPRDRTKALVIHPTFSKTEEKDSNFPFAYAIPIEAVPKRLL